MKMNVKGNDLYKTPDEIYKQLDDIFNFTMDVACTSLDCKAPNGFFHDKNQNALETKWGGDAFVIHLFQ